MVKTAYITLWYPKPSETFIFREVSALRSLGLPIKVFTLYGKITKCVCRDMEYGPVPVQRLGSRSFWQCLKAVKHWWDEKPLVLTEVARCVLLRRWRDMEQTGENAWAFLAGCRLAQMFETDEVQHIHAGWANGPATAAWTASMLTGIPFSFSGRAGDIYPPCGALEEKLAAAAFVRTDAAFNIDYLGQFAPERKSSIHLVRNMLSWDTPKPAPVPMRPPYRILAVGRFVKTKGLDVLLEACKIVADRGIDFRLTLAGSGLLERSLKGLAKDLGLADKVSFPGFVLHDQVPDLIRGHDIFVMPSQVKANGDRDGLPTVIMEALVTGVPVVATDVGGIREVIHDGQTGLLVKQRDPLAMAEAVIRLAYDRAAALRMAEQGKRLVLDYYNTGRNSRRFFELITNHAPA